MTVVAQLMVPSEVSGILFTANPTTGERGELIINASFGLGEAVVNGRVTPDTYIIARNTRTAKETIIGPKAQKIVADGAQGIRPATRAARGPQKASHTTVVPEEARENKYIARAEAMAAQITNDDSNHQKL